MSQNIQSKFSKLSLQALHKFQYYSKQIIPELFALKENGTTELTCKTNQGISYMFSTHKKTGEYNFNLNTVIHSVKGTYLTKKFENESIAKVGANSYSKKNFLEKAKKNISQLLQISVSDKTAQSTKNSEVVKQDEITLYIVHHHMNNQQSQNNYGLKWLSFVEQIQINNSEIKQTIIATISGSKNFFSWGCKVTSFEQLVKSYCRIDTIQGYLLQFAQSIKKLPGITDPAFNEEQNPLKKIPGPYLMNFYHLRKQFGQDKTNDICRFLIAKDFKLDQTRIALQQYFEWKEQMLSKYKWEDFSEIHALGIFKYLGQDDFGRPVILNRSNRLNIYQIDLEKYCIYYMFFLEIYISSLMRGYVYQMVIIADTANNKSQNFKLSITKRNLSDCLKYGAERQYKLIAVNADSITVYVYKILKPVIPKRSQDKIMAIGGDKKQILNTLCEYMSPEIIPSYLGGQNNQIF